VTPVGGAATVPAAGGRRRYSERVTSDEPGTEIESLHQTVERLQQENEELRDQERGGGSAKGPWWKRIVAWVLVVVACLLAVVSVIAVFGRNELLNTDTYVATVAPLASNPDVQAAVATKVSDELDARVNIEQKIKNALPRKAGFLADPIASAVQGAAGQLTLRVVQSAAFEKVWVEVNRASHKQLVALLTGSDQGAVSSANGRVTLDLSKLGAEVKSKLDARGITIFDHVPAAKLTFVLFQSDQLSKYQRWVRLLNHLVVVLPIVTLLLLAGSVVLTANRRRGLVRAATGLALSMALILVVVAVARNQYLNGLSPSQSRAANAAVIDTVSASLREIARTVLIVAAVVAVGAVLAGNRQIRAWVGRRETPDWMSEGPAYRFVSAHRKGLQWVTLAVGLIVLVIWSNPTALVAVVVAALTLAMVGLVGLFGTRRSAGSRSPAMAAAGAPALDVSPEADPGDKPTTSATQEEST